MQSGDFFCLCPQHVLETAHLSQWPDPDLPWTLVDLVPGLSEEELQAAMTWALDQWAKVCGIKPRYVTRSRDARLLVGSRRIDGNGGVLAECQLPQGGMKQVRMWFDVLDQWTDDIDQQTRSIIVQLVGWHEAGHAIGLGHAPQGSPNIMAPTYSPRQLTAGVWDRSETVRRYGPPRPTAPPSTPTPSPAPSGGLMGNIGLIISLLAKYGPLLAKLGPLLEMLVKFGPQLTSIIDVVVRVLNSLPSADPATARTVLAAALAEPRPEALSLDALFGVLPKLGALLAAFERLRQSDEFDALVAAVMDVLAGVLPAS